MSTKRPTILEPPSKDPTLVRVRWYDHVGRKRQQSFRADDPSERSMRRAMRSAEEFRDELVRKLGRGDRTTSEKLTVDEFFDEWWESVVDSPKIAASTANGSYGPAFEHRILPYMGTATLASIDAETIDKFVAWMGRRDVGPQTMRNTVTALSSMLQTAVKWRRIPFNPCHGVELPAVPDADRRAYDLETIYDIAAAMRFDRDRALVVVAAWIGQRKTDVYELRWEHVDVDAGTLRVYRRKPKKWDTIPLFEPARLALEWWREVAPFTAPGDPVFSSERGTPLSKQASGWYRRYWRPACARVGLVRCASAACRRVVDADQADRLALDPTRGRANLARWESRMRAAARGERARPSGPRPIEPWACPECGEQSVVGPVFHELRHSFGSHAAYATGDLGQVARWGGWSSTKMLERRYMHELEAGRSRATQAMNDLARDGR